MSSNLSLSFSQFKFEMDNGRVHSIYEFDNFRLDCGKLMLYRGGDELSLPPKAVETLAVLVKARGAIVSKDELIDSVWTDSVVEESNLSQYLYVLRKNLGKRPDGSPYIETLRRRGYRFTADIRRFTESVNGSVPQRPALSHSERRPVERRGNVLALADWRESELRKGPADAIRTEPVESATPTSRKGYGLLAAGWAAIVLMIIGFSAFYVSRPVAHDSASEQSVLPLTNGVEVVDATISPDGKYFVYHEPHGKLFRIWLQQTGHSTRREVVPASERIPLTKSFTPDGQFIYFLALDKPGDSGSIFRVAAFGGPLTKVLSDVSSGVSFSSDGRQMVFSRHKDGVMTYAIKNSDGSGEEKVLHTAKTDSGSSAWSPDGKAIIVQLSGDENELGCVLAAADPESHEIRRLSDETWDVCGRMEWSLDGRGLYMIGTRRGEGMTTRREQVFYISYPEGKSRKITSDGNRHQSMSLGVTKDGDVLAVPFNRSSQIWVMDPNGDSRSAVQITSGVADGRAGIGPLADGRVAYIARTGENLNVWVMNQDGLEKRQITENPSAIQELRSGGDGRYLVFSGTIDSNRTHLFRIDADGNDLEQITSGDEQQIDSSMSYDGKWIAYDSAAARGGKVQISLWKQRMDGGERISLNRHDCQMPHFSPDDKFISCVREQKDILILSSVDGTLVRTIQAPLAATLQHSLNFGARWAPDGKAVVYIVNENGVSNIWRHPIDGSSPKQLTNFTSGNIYHFAYSLDGSRLFLARGNQVRDAILIRQKL